MRNNAILSVIVTVTLWSSAFVGIRYTMGEFSAGGMAFYRYLVASIAMLIIFYFVKKKHKPEIQDFWGFSLLGFLGFAIYNVLLNYGEISVNASVANFIIAQVPVFVAIIALFFLNERMNKIGLLGLIVSILGAGIIFLSEDKFNMGDGIFSIYLAALCAAIYSVLQKRYLKKGYSPIEITSYSIWLGTIMLLFYAPDAYSEMLQASCSANLTVIYMGIFPGAIAYSAWCNCFKYIPAAKAATYLYYMPILTMSLSWVFLSQVPIIGSIIGGIIACIGSLIVNRWGMLK
jgi:drug/metabolite transporter (DMT)-like permease